MDENTKKIQREIARDKIQIILSSIAVAVLIIMELYIMINFKSNFMFMAAGILLMIVALFFLISGLMDMSLKNKDMEAQKYEEIYNAQKASYLVIKKSFDELDIRLRNIEESSSLPAEDIINAQKAVAKVTISRSKENTDALMNSNDELINQLFAIKEKLESNNNQIIEKQQALLKETNFDIQQKIAELTSQISNIEGKIQNGVPVMAQPMMVPPGYGTPQMTPPPTMVNPVEELSVQETPAEAPIAEPAEDIGIDLDMAVAEEAPVEELPQEEVSAEEIPVEETPIEEEAVEPVEEIPVEEASAEPVEDIGIDLDMAVAEEAPVEELPQEEVSAEEIPVEETAIEEELVEEIPVEEAPAEPVEEASAEPVEDIGIDLDMAAAEETPVEEVPNEEIILESAPETPAEEIIISEEPSVDLDALLEEVGGPAEEEETQQEEITPEAPPEEEKSDEIIIPDVGVDLTDPNRVMSAEEIEKLFANI